MFQKSPNKWHWVRAAGCTFNWHTQALQLNEQCKWGWTQRAALCQTLWDNCHRCSPAACTLIDPHLCFKHTDAEAGGCYKANSSLSDFARPCCLRVDVGHVRPLVPRLATSPPGETMCDADRLQYRQPSTWHLHKTQANSYNARRRLSIRSHSSGHTDTAQTQRYG